MTLSTLRRNVFIGLQVAALIWTSSLLSQQPGICAAGKMMSGFELEQVTSCNGKFRVLACSTAVRLDQLTYGYSFISSAPAWDVVVFRNDTKEYSRVPYKEWLRANLILVTTIWTMELKKPIATRHSEQGGLGYITYTFPSTTADSAFLGNTGRDEAKALQNNRGEVVCLDFPADIHAGGVIGRAVALPELQGIAMQITRRSAATNGWLLKTVKTKHRDDISSESFALPKGLKQVPFSRSMFSSSSAKDGINYMFGAPGE
jgi:hypothetical protein